jgi:hypothetical protein
MEKNYKTTPLRVVRRESGYLLFSDSNIGKEGLENYLQYTADHFFDPHAHDGALEIYEYSGFRKELVSHINSSCRRGLLPGRDRKDGYVSSGILPAEFINSLEPKLYVPMNPTSEGYSRLFSLVKGYTGLELFRKPENEDIYRLLSIREHGYMNIHDKPFTYYRELLPLAKQFEKVTQVRSAGLFDVQAFKELSLKIRKAAEDILHRDFDVRGHRSLEKYLNAPDTSLLVGNTVLDKVQLGILAKGNALYLPENGKPSSRHLLYCMADFTRNKLLVSGEPFPARTYRVKDGIPYPVSPQEKTPEKKRTPRKSTGRKMS